ncbi:MAG: hypothetical protein ABI448_01905 [Bacteroidia bacterium]
MKIILLTGLDGSGKSLLLNKLESISTTKHIAFIRLPKIDSELFKHNPSLYKTILFINKMHIDADYLKKPPLKVVALFSAMLVFKKLLNELDKNNTKLVFCERHPLIDTGVYAKFYIGKMDPATLEPNIVNSIDSNFTKEIYFLLKLIGIEQKLDKPFYTLLNYIHEWFSINKKHELTDLKELFKLNLPDKIFYLSASAKILMERIKTRQVIEAHESIETFKKLIPVYENVLQHIGMDTTIVDANTYLNLDQFFEELKRIYF